MRKQLWNVFIERVRGFWWAEVEHLEQRGEKQDCVKMHPGEHANTNKKQAFCVIYM